MKYSRTVLVLISLQLLFIHWTIGGAKVDCTLGYRFDAPAGTDGLVVDLQIGILLVILIKPFGIYRIRKGRARPIDGQSVGPKNSGEPESNQSNCCNSLHMHLHRWIWSIRHSLAFLCYGIVTIRRELVESAGRV